MAKEGLEATLNAIVAVLKEMVDGENKWQGPSLAQEVAARLELPVSHVSSCLRALESLEVITPARGFPGRTYVFGASDPHLKCWELRIPNAYIAKEGQFFVLVTSPEA